MRAFPPKPSMPPQSATSPLLSAAAQQLPPHVSQHVFDLGEQLPRLAEHAVLSGAALIVEAKM